MVMRSITLFMAMSVLAIGVGASDDPQTGTWKLNIAQSRYSSGAEPKSSTSTIETYGTDGVKVRPETINAKGEKFTTAWSAKYDGKEYPRIETGPGAVRTQTVRLKRIDAYTAERTTYLAGKKRNTEQWVI